MNWPPPCSRSHRPAIPPSTRRRPARRSGWTPMPPASRTARCGRRSWRYSARRCRTPSSSTKSFDAIMNASNPDSRIDRLNQLLPAIYRMRDAGQQYALQVLLRVIAEQVNVVEYDIAQRYENWFIETADDWAVPYIADLIGYRPVRDAGPAADGSRAEGRALNRILIPRREAANTIRYRRRKGTL